MASSYLSRTPASAGNRTTWTYSFWLKKTKITGDQVIFSAGIAGNDTICYFQSADHSIHWFNRISSSMTATRITSQVFRDVSAWYHFVFVWDTTNATALDRMRIYLNGSQITSFSSTLNPSSSLNSFWNSANAHQIMSDNSPPANLSDGLLASVYFIDGQALTPSSFGQTDATTGIWKPLSYSGTYGTNGFYLKFANSASLGTDSSGNGNNFTVGGTPTQTQDTPSNIFATLNSLNNGGLTLSNGNLTSTGVGSHYAVTSTLAVNKGKWYWEVKNGTDVGGNGFGIMGIEAKLSDQLNSTPSIWVRSSGNKFRDSVDGGAYMSFANGDIIGVALDMDNGTIIFYKNGTSQGTAYSSINNGTVYSPALKFNNSGDTAYINFGNGYFATTAISSPYSDAAGLGKFQYQPPTGYYSLCTKNINLQG